MNRHVIVIVIAKNFLAYFFVDMVYIIFALEIVNDLLRLAKKFLALSDY